MSRQRPAETIGQGRHGLDEKHRKRLAGHSPA
ncbi:Hypothetical protein PFREUD_02990 [Propionibacterium freudenreichii subsp. shermanii CIRM-BIA1]|uniref:Uncharacterized protein n=1 Tax=Propionibacterium freudenreichii subsp. shermanii (strain ATCC 9614 / DSM 4902 / CIP 103027 / NCIMB 8099 / CIRM-BIA1) TaxID=754252 RepID=D7GIA6_PROFC|nr:Hypothetical protein PFREUD_02990 [Propionibacterium freudenreichii subsp. shermanii CIRM-BIA1]